MKWEKFFLLGFFVKQKAPAREILWYRPPAYVRQDGGSGMRNRQTDRPSRSIQATPHADRHVYRSAGVPCGPSHISVHARSGVFLSNTGYRCGTSRSPCRTRFPCGRRNRSSGRSGRGLRAYQVVIPFVRSISQILSAIWSASSRSCVERKIVLFVLRVRWWSNCMISTLLGKSRKAVGSSRKITGVS